MKLVAHLMGEDLPGISAACLKGRLAQWGRVGREIVPHFG